MRKKNQKMNCRFNSNMVRLKVAIARNKRKDLLCFNSNMVRLKDNSGRYGGYCRAMFQFQYGTIKRFLT